MNHLIFLSVIFATSIVFLFINQFLLRRQLNNAVSGLRSVRRQLIQERETSPIAPRKRNREVMQLARDIENANDVHDIGG